MCTDSIQLLYGTFKDDWRKDYHSGTGIAESTIQRLGGSALFLSESGLSSLDAVDDYGDFDLGGWGDAVKPLLDLTAEPTCSVLLKKKNQYWLFCDDGTALICRFYGSNTVGITVAKFHNVVEVAVSGKIDGKEEVFIGTTSGQVFQLNTGTSFDSTAIQTTLAVAFNRFGSPIMRKRFRRVFLEIEAETSLQLSVLPQFDFGDQAIARHMVLFKQTVAQGGQWGVSNWSEFSWGSPIVDQSKIDVVGSGTALNFIVSASSATAKPHTITGYTTHYTPRRHIHG